jgi:hypothetical protein
MKRADEVFAERMIDPDLAADRAVDLRHHSRRNLHETYSAKICCRSKPDKVADDAAANGDDHRRSIGVHLDQCFIDTSNRDVVLESFAVGNQNRFGFG